MSKKYEIVRTDKVTTENGRTLYRIRALVDVDEYALKGTLGGYIEEESNLSHEGKAWVYHRAQVYDKAQVYDDASVWGDAQVYGEAQVYGNAKVYDRAKVYGKAQLSCSARVRDDACLCGVACMYGSAMARCTAKVCGNARVHGDAEIESSALVDSDRAIVWFSNVGDENTTLSVYKGRCELLISYGMYWESAEDFLARSRADSVQEEFEALIKVARSRIYDTAMHEEEEHE